VKYRHVGSSEVQVSEISLGTGDNAGGIVYGSPEVQRAIVGRALDLGINLFDTSPDYGKGLAEVNLGRTLRELGDPEVVIATKVEVMPEHLDMISVRMQESVNDSLTRLGRDHLDVVMVHNPCQRERRPAQRLPWTPLVAQDLLGPALEGLLKARDAGKVGMLGLACEQADVDAVRAVLGSGEFGIINVWFNLANPSAAFTAPAPGLPKSEQYPGLLDVAADRGVGVVVIRPLAGGALTESVLHRGHEGRHQLSGGYYSWHPEVLAPEIERGRMFGFLARPGEQTLAEAAYSYILADSRVTSVVGGFSDVTHFDDAVAAMDGTGLSEADLDKIRDIQTSGALAVGST